MTCFQRKFVLSSLEAFKGQILSKKFSLIIHSSRLFAASVSMLRCSSIYLCVCVCPAHTLSAAIKRKTTILKAREKYIRI